MNAKYLISMYSIMSESTLMTPISSCMYRVKLERRMLHKNCVKLVRVILLDSYFSQFITLIIKKYNNRYLTLLCKFFLIPNRISKFVYLRK